MPMCDYASINEVKYICISIFLVPRCLRSVANSATQIDTLGMGCRRGESRVVMREPLVTDSGMISLPYQLTQILQTPFHRC